MKYINKYKKTVCKYLNWLEFQIAAFRAFCKTGRYSMVYPLSFIKNAVQDASSVRATHPIPASCGLYYFEVRIVSKGRDGYMGVGLCAQEVNMNR